MKDAHKIAHETILFLTKIPAMAKNGIINIAQAVCHSSFPSPQMGDCGSTHKRYENNKSTGTAKSQKKAEANLRETSILELPIATGRLKITDRCGALLRSSVWWCSGFGCLCLLRQAGNRKMRRANRTKTHRQLICLFPNASRGDYYQTKHVHLGHYHATTNSNMAELYYLAHPILQLLLALSFQLLIRKKPFQPLWHTHTAKTQTTIQTNFS